ncbi:venom allergen-1-like [Drosophila tropicalis]|uniref:venom allergen-1-like n=1 Tax=Drosophila tropicalis TaxID=46794 RepID=UPI0035ABE5AC
MIMLNLLHIILILPIGIQMLDTSLENFVNSFPKLSCRPDLCPKETISLGCITSESFSEACGSNNEIWHVNGQMRQGILSTINTMRNLVASGANNFSVAAHMPVMRWDRNLSLLARVALRQCDSEGRYCANTEKYNFVTTTEISSTLEKSHSLLKHVLNRFMPTWLYDILGCRMDSSNRIVPVDEGRCVGHYVPFIEDKGNRMGCALRKRFTLANSTNTVTLLCHISRANVNDMVPYEIGETPGDKCNTGLSRMYIGLCADAEIVDANAVKTEE